MKKFFKYVLAIASIFIIAGLIFLFRPISSGKIATANNEPVADVVLIGGGIMSATLGTYLQLLQPDWTIQLYERLGDVALESSDTFNNAGTGHSGFMEMNYTEEVDGVMQISKAEAVANQFEISKQFWSYLVKTGHLKDPKTFINPVPHHAFVMEQDGVDFLKKRYAAMVKSPLFKGMQYTEDKEQIRQWAPLVINGRDPQQQVAATRMEIGSDVNYGALTRELIANLKTANNFSLHTHSEVNAISRNDDNTWTVQYKNTQSGDTRHVKTRFVFIGAGGAAIKLLQLTGLKEAKYYAGFPVGGEFLVTDNPQIAAQHTAKLYGRADLGAPPMSVPHIDTRYLDGKKYVLFGPFATYSNKFLKEGSQLDLLNATHKSNAWPMTKVGLENLDLVKYLIGQVAMSDQDRFNELKRYYPEAKFDDWHLSIAGQRVQIIKQLPGQKATLQFGTEIFTASDGSVAALLGASPGASTSPYIMLNLLAKAFPQQTQGPWNKTLHEIIRSYQQDLITNPQLLDDIRHYTSATLGLHYKTPEGLLPTAVNETHEAH